MESSNHLQLGSRVQGGSTTFRLLFPGAKSVDCLIFHSFGDTDPDVWPMKPADEDIWHLTLPEDLSGKWYQYDVTWQEGERPDTPYADEPFADPFSKHVTVWNHYRQQAKTLLFQDTYDWEGDTFLPVADPRDLVIYETHIKDLVAHPSSASTGEGVYQRWLDLDQTGGIPHLEKLGINAVEFLPLQKFPPPEPPFKEKTKEGFYNTWNCYSQNYWGYMTSFFMAPETLYASDAGGSPNCTSSGTAEGRNVDGGTGNDSIVDSSNTNGGTANEGAAENRSVKAGTGNGGTVNGGTTAAVRELKDVVKLLHSKGIAVIMDVVYNHTSLFDINPFCHHLEGIYLRRDEHGQLRNRSGTGNEMRTEHPYVQAMMIESLTYWMKEFHIDGFRFDLAGLIDENSWDVIRKALKAVNPDALLIAEPWGGRYVPWLFSNHGWSSWNDRFRNGIKGSNPHDDRGFIFSGWHHGGDRKQLENWFQGTIRELEGGLFRDSSHAVNYLESHDGYTLGDFIRISTRYNGENLVTENREEHVRLTREEARIAKLGAFCLMVTPGMTMIHAGQEFARSKIIIDTDAGDDEQGRMDYNSYNKDNETNWINFDDLTLNRNLFNYYRGLIQIRKESPALRKAGHHSISFEHVVDALHICFLISGADSGDLYDYYVVINATKHHDLEFTLPGGVWEQLATDGFASATPVKFLSGLNRLPPLRASLLRRLRH